MHVCHVRVHSVIVICVTLLSMFYCARVTVYCLLPLLCLELF